MKKSSLAAAAILGALVLSPFAGHAAELKVLAGGSMTASLKELGPKFEAATGHKLDIYFGATPQLIEQAKSTPFDVAVVPVDVFKNADAKAKFAAGPTIDIARVGYGVAVRAGSNKPDIGTPDAFKQALLNAKSITYLPQSAAGAYVTSVFERLGIGEAMKAKTVAQTATAQISQAIATGGAELGVFLTNVMIAPGVEPVGPFPAELQNDLVFAGGVAANSKDAGAAKAFLDYLKTPEAVAVFKAKGVKPG